jgi:hypothetical protein
MAANGCAFIPVGPEGDAIIERYVRFPVGRHDEEIVMASIMGRAIAVAHPAIASPPPKEAKPVKGVHETFNDLEASQPRRGERIQTGG